MSDIHHGFEPDPARARALDGRMHAELAASLEHVRDRCRGVVRFDEAAIGALIDELEGGARHPARTFGEYHRLVEALLDGDHAAAEARFEALARARPREPGTRVGPLHDPAGCERCALLHETLTSDPDTEVDFRPPPDDVAAAFEARYRRGAELMERALPALAGEVAGIVHEVVAVVGDPASETRFDGGSHFRLWGALFLDAESHATGEAIVEAVAHESAHGLLFGFSVEEPLVLDGDEAVWRSPLRPDPRPMDGIYHATFVSARMHWAMSRLLESGALSEEGRDRARAARDRDRAAFEDGYRVVTENGSLSAHGAGLLRGARDWMDAASP